MRDNDARFVWGFFRQGLNFAGSSLLGRFLRRSEGRSPVGRGARATYLYSVDPRDLNHDAVIRIGGRAPERWAHSTRRPESHSCVRVTTTSDRHRMPSNICSAEAPKSLVYPAASSRAHRDPNEHLAGRRKTPQFDQQLARHGDDQRLRVPCRASTVRERYHWARALSF